jgi:hypothetical protein
MATPQQVQELRALAAYTDVEPYDDSQLSALIDDADSLERVAARLWNEKASKMATLVNISESGSSRSLGDAHKNALGMAKYYKGLADEAEAETPIDTGRFARTRPAVREG